MFVGVFARWMFHVFVFEFPGDYLVGSCARRSSAFAEGQTFVFVALACGLLGRVVIAGVDLRERACYLDVRLVAYVWRGGGGR